MITSMFSGENKHTIVNYWHELQGYFICVTYEDFEGYDVRSSVFSNFLDLVVLENREARLLEVKQMFCTHLQCEKSTNFVPRSIIEFMKGLIMSISADRA